MSVSGLFAKDKNISIAGSVVNLILSIILGIKFGTLGILLGTLASLVIQIILKIRLLYTERFKINSGKYYFRFIFYSGIGIVIMILAKFISAEIAVGSLYIDFVLKAAVSIFVPLCMNYVFFCRTEEYVYLKELMWKFVNKMYTALTPVISRLYKKRPFGKA